MYNTEGYSLEPGALYGKEFYQLKVYEQIFFSKSRETFKMKKSLQKQRKMKKYL